MADETFKVVGSSGLKRWSGTVEDEFLRELQGVRGRKVYREMAEQDAVLSGILFAIEMLCRRVDWHVAPGSDDPADRETADFLESCFQDLTPGWEDTLSDILSFLPFGWAWHEIIYKHRDGDSDDPTRRSKFTDGKIGWRSIAIRAQESLDRWEWDKSGELLGMVQTQQSGPAVLIPAEKSLHFRTSARRGNPEGRSILRGAYRSWYFKRNIETVEAIGIERDLAGLPVIYAPPEIMSPNATAEQQAVYEELKKIATSIRRDEQEGLVVPAAYDDKGNPRYKLELLSSGGSRQFNTDAVINRHDSRMAMTVLADFILLGHEKVGNFALASSKTSLFAYALGAWLDGISAVFTEQAFPRLLKLNGLMPKEPPRLEHGDIEEADLQELGTFLQTLSNAGMPLFPNPELEAHILRVAGLPAATAEGEV